MRLHISFFGVWLSLHYAKSVGVSNIVVQILCTLVTRDFRSRLGRLRLRETSANIRGGSEHFAAMDSQQFTIRGGLSRSGNVSRWFRGALNPECATGRDTIMMIANAGSTREMAQKLKETE